MKFTENFNLNLPDLDDKADIRKINENFSKIDESMHTHVTNSEKHLPEGGAKGQVPIKDASGIIWGTIRMLEDFDNLPEWGGCIRTTSVSGNVWTEEIKTTSGKLRAKRVTQKNAEDNYTEVYMFYEENGVDIAGTYTVTTEKEVDGSWKESVTGGDNI